jgi:hypothetical protein
MLAQRHERIAERDQRIGPAYRYALACAFQQRRLASRDCSAQRLIVAALA